MPSHKAPSPRTYAALYALAALTAWWVGPSGPVYWDSFGYVIQSLTGRVGGLMLGRPTFVLSSHALCVFARSLGASVTSAEPLLRVWWMLISASGAPALAWVASRAGVTTRASVSAGVLLALSPTVAHTSYAVLTDAPAMSVSLFSIGLGLSAMRARSRPRMFCAGLTLGLASGMREQSIVHLAALLSLAGLAQQKRWSLALMAVLGSSLSLAAPVVWVALHQRSYLPALSDWGRSMTSERAQHPYGARDFGMFLVWLLTSGAAPLGALVTSLTSGWRPRGLPRPLQALVSLSALQLGALAFYQDIAFSPRYLLGALPLGLVLPGSIALDAVWNTARLRRGVFAVAVLFACLAGPAMRHIERALREGLATLPARLRALPPNAAVVTGQLCPAVVYHRELARLEPQSRSSPSWIQVCPGWRWPVDLSARLDQLRSTGHPVVIDLRRASWVGDRQERCRREAESYALAHRGEVTLWR